MIVGIDPKVDYAFKFVFGRESTRPILIDVLDSVLSAPGRHIRDLELLNPFNDKESLDDKLSILDIKARDESGRQFNVEMQMLAYRYYEKRILYYAARLHQQQLQQGQDYLELKPTVSISFLDHVMFPDVPDCHLHFRLLEERHQFPLTSDIEFHVLELPKFTKTLAQLQTRLDCWLYFLRKADKMDRDALPPQMQEPLVVRAFEELLVLNQTDVERERYEARRKWQLDYNTGMKVARMEGREEGEIKGREEGREEGKQIAINMIHFCERLLNRLQSPADELRRQSLAELTQIANRLQAEIHKPT